MTTGTKKTSMSLRNRQSSAIVAVLAFFALIGSSWMLFENQPLTADSSMSKSPGQVNLNHSAHPGGDERLGLLNGTELKDGALQSMPKSPGQVNLSHSVHPDGDERLSLLNNDNKLKDGVLRNIIPLHIIEQLGGAFVSLFNLAAIVHKLGYRTILPGLAENTSDHTVFRGYADPSIKPFSHYFDMGMLKSNGCLSSDFNYRRAEDHHEISPTLDAVLIVVHDWKGWFKPDKNGLMKNGVCKEMFNQCKDDVSKCQMRFTWKLDVDLNYWIVEEHTTVLCFSHKLENYNMTLENILQSSHFLDSNATNIAILNWMGVGCGGPRVCTPYAVKPWDLRRGCFNASDHIINIAETALVAAKLKDADAKAVSFRTEMLPMRNATQPCIEQYLKKLQNVTMSWGGKWLRFIDYKDGGSTTLGNDEWCNMINYKWYIDQLDLFWDSMNVTFVDVPCGNLNEIECGLRDAVMLANTEEVHAWAPGGGFFGNVQILRSHGSKNQSIHVVDFDPALDCSGLHRHN